MPMPIDDARHADDVTARQHDKDKKQQEKKLSPRGSAALREWLRARRAAMGMTQGQLAEKWNVPQPSLSEAENGQGLGVALLERIADAEGISIDAMIGRPVGLAAVPELADVPVETLVQLVRVARAGVGLAPQATPGRVVIAGQDAPPRIDLVETASGRDENNLPLAVSDKTTDPKPAHAPRRKSGKGGVVSR